MEEKMKSIKGTISFLFMCTLIVSFAFSNGADVQRKLTLELKASALNSSDKANQGAMRIAKGIEFNNVKVNPDQDKIDYYMNSIGHIPTASNDSNISSRDCAAGDPEYTWSCGGGSWGSEISWTLSDGSSGVTGEGIVCLADGDYTLTMNDSYGDGWTGNTWSLTDVDGNVVASGGLADGATGDYTFTLGGAAPISGCTDATAENFDAEATMDDGSCTWNGGCSSSSYVSCASGDECVPASYWCDGSIDNGNGSWGADCADGSDEVADDCCANSDGTGAYDDAFCNGEAPNNDGLCFDDADYNYDLDGDGYVDAESTCGYYVLYQGMSCEDVEYYGIDCTTVADCGGCVVDACSEAGGSPAWVGDGWCDGANNNDACGFDGGDCCACDCVSGTYDCDLYGGGDCQNPTGDDGSVECWDGSMVCDALDCAEQPGGCDDGFTGYLMNCGGGEWGSEVSWTLSDGTAGGAPYSETACLADGDYTLSMVDAYGDSWNGNAWTLTNEAGDLFASCTLDGVNDDGAAGDCSFTLGATAPVVGCMDPEACNYDATATIEAECFMDDCAGECGGTAESDCAGECGGAAIADDCGECNGDGTACAGCAYPTWFADGYCDGSNNDEACGYDGGDCCPGDCVDGSYACVDFGGDCADCADPNSADNAPGGECDIATADAPGNLACAGDWSVDNGSEINLTWDASEGADGYEVFYFFETCEDQGLVTCLDGSCEAIEDDCPDATCGDLGGVEAYLADGYCDSINNFEGCNFDAGDCCPGECADTVDNGCPDNPDGCYGTTPGAFCGTCDDCADTSSPDLADDGECGGGWTTSCADTTCGYYLNYGYTCDDLAYYDIDCSACADEGMCDGGTTGCAEGEFECADGGCIPGSYYCDGSADNGNATWGPDCADGSDEVMTECCDNGSYDAADCGGGTGGGAEACADAGGFYCGDDEANWTSYSPEGCVPANYICDGWEDCVDASDEAGCAAVGCAESTCGYYLNYGYTCDDLAYYGIDCTACADEGACGGGVVVNEGNGNASEKLEFFNNVKEERAELYSDRRSPFNLVNPPMIVDVDGNVLLDPTPNNRTISYEVHASCETCLDGGPWENTYTSASTDFLVYGFDEGNSACAEVRALSDLSNEVSEWSGSACANAGCGPDCVAGDANGDLSVNVSDIVILVNVILNLGGATDGVECADMNGDASITVTDIVGIIQIILNPMANADAEATDAQLNLGSDVTLSSNGQISAIQMVLSHDSNFSLELTQDAWVADYATTDNKTTLIVVMPNSDFVFTPNGEFTIEETIVLSSTNEIDVTVNAIPVEFSVSNAYPNPFNPITAINISLPTDGMVNVSVYNVAGQMVDAVFNNSLTAGSHSISWDAGNLSSGVYLIRTEAGKNISTQKVMLLK